MGNNEAGTPTKSDKASSSVQEKPAILPYPDWATMQAYYGPGVAMPHPYFGTSVAPGHAPHPYLWGPQPFIPPPFGTPYTAIYPAGGVYSHPPLPLGSHMQYQGIAPTPTISEAVVMATPLSMEMPAKSPSNKDKGLMKKLKGFDGLAVSMDNENAENRGDVNGSSQSEGDSAEGSSDGNDGNDGNNAVGNKTRRKQSSEVIWAPGDDKVGTQANAARRLETSASSKMSLGITVAPANISGKPFGTVPSSTSPPGMEMRVASIGKVQASGTPISPATGAMTVGRNGAPSEVWIQDERELKRERRKQSNRESARRSRLRKQAETEELATKVETLGAENMALRSEISQLSESSDKLRLENSALMEQLKSRESSQADEMSSADKMENEGTPSVVAENLLSIMDNPGSVSPSAQEDEACENSGGKLHQLLGSNPRTDAVAAS